MNQISILTPAATGEDNVFDGTLVSLCTENDVPAKLEPDLPVVDELDYSSFETENNKVQWTKWTILDAAIKKLMVALHDQYRQNVELKRTGGDVKMVIQRMGRGRFGNRQVITLEEFTMLYTHVFEMVSNERLGRATRLLFKQYVARCSFFAEHHCRNSIESVADGVPFLIVLVATSRNFWTFLHIMVQIFMSLDSSRTYSIHESRPSIYLHGQQVYHKQIFDISFSPSRYRLVDSMIGVYRKFRCRGTDTDVTIYTDVIAEVFEKIKTTSHDAFVKDYQEHFLKDISSFYASLGKFWRTGAAIDERYVEHFPQWVGSGNVNLTQYTRLVQQSMLNECELIERTHKNKKVLLNKSRMEMNAVLVSAAIGEDNMVCRTSIDELFAKEEWAPLKMVYSTFKADRRAIQIISDSLLEYIVTCGKNLIIKAEQEYKQFRKDKIETLFKGSLSAHNKRALDNAIRNKTEVLKGLISKSREHERLVDDVFEKSFDMSKAKRTAYTTIALMTVDGIPQEELLPIYVNRIINGIEYSNDIECEEALTELTYYFLSLTNKDVFMAYHRDLLAKRILSFESKPNTHLENHLLQKLSQREGVQFTNNAEKQILDYHEKAEQNRKFTQWLSEKSIDVSLLPEFEVQVIAHKSWPVEKNLSLFNECELSPQLIEWQNMFNNFYQDITRKRMLKWLPRVSYCSLSFKPHVEAARSYRIVGTTQQAAILRTFKGFDSQVTLERLQSTLGIGKGSSEPERDHFTRVLKTIIGVKCKLLIKVPGDGDESYRINKDFKHNDRIIKLQEPFVNIAADKGKIKEDRKIAISYTIVKSMKLRKEMIYQKLINECMDQLKHFKPEVRQVKEALEEIIAKEWIRRDPECADKLIYNS